MKLNLDSKEVRQMALRFRFRRPTEKEKLELSKISPSERNANLIKRIDEDGPITFREAMIFSLELLTYQWWSVQYSPDEVHWFETIETVLAFCAELKTADPVPQDAKILRPAPEVFAERQRVKGSLQDGYDFSSLLDEER